MKGLTFTAWFLEVTGALFRTNNKASWYLSVTLVKEKMTIQYNINIQTISF